MQSGLRAHNIACDISHTLEAKTAHHGLIVTWGLNDVIYDRPHLILEAGYVNGHSGSYQERRLRFISASWSRPHGLSAGFEADYPSDRFDALDIRLCHWKTKGHYVLMLGQHPGDYAAPSDNIWRSLKATLEAAQYDVRERPHPLVRASTTSLEVQLRHAEYAVTWSSTAAVEAIFAGVPVYALHPMCIASPVCADSLSDPVRRPDRRQWAYNLAYRQYTLEEIASGLMWEYVYGGAPSSSDRAAAAN